MISVLLIFNFENIFSIQFNSVIYHVESGIHQRVDFTHSPNQFDNRHFASSFWIWPQMVPFLDNMPAIVKSTKILLRKISSYMSPPEKLVDLKFLTSATAAQGRFISSFTKGNMQRVQVAP